MHGGAGFQRLGRESLPGQGVLRGLGLSGKGLSGSVIPSPHVSGAGGIGKEPGMKTPGLPVQGSLNGGLSMALAF